MKAVCVITFVFIVCVFQAVHLQARPAGKAPAAHGAAAHAVEHVALR